MSVGRIGLGVYFVESFQFSANTNALLRLAINLKYYRSDPVPPGLRAIPLNKIAHPWQGGHFG
jgi:hypothetical protein